MGVALDLGCFDVYLLSAAGSARTKPGEIIEGSRRKERTDKVTGTLVPKQKRQTKHNNNKIGVARMGPRQGKLDQNPSLRQRHVLTRSTESSTDIKV